MTGKVRPLHSSPGDSVAVRTKALSGIGKLNRVWGELVVVLGLRLVIGVTTPCSSHPAAVLPHPALYRHPLEDFVLQQYIPQAYMYDINHRLVKFV